MPTEKKMIRKDAREVFIDALVQARKVCILLGAVPAPTVCLDLRHIGRGMSRQRAGAFAAAQRSEFNEEPVQANGVHDCERRRAAVTRKAYTHTQNTNQHTNKRG